MQTLFATIVLTMFSLLNSIRIKENNNIYHPCLDDILLENFHKNYSIVFESYDKVNLMKYYFNDKLLKCIERVDLYIEFLNPSKIESQTKDLNSTMKLPLKKISENTLISEITYSHFSNCHKYNTTYVSVFDCAMFFNIDLKNNINDFLEYSEEEKNNTVSENLNLNFNTKMLVLKNNFSIRIVDSVIQNNVPIGTVNSLLYTYEYNSGNTKSKNYNITLDKCNGKCFEKSKFFNFNDFTKIYFKLDAPSNFNLFKVVLTVDENQIGTDFISNKFLSINNTHQNKDNKLNFYMDVTDKVLLERNFYSLTLPSFPKKFNLLFTYSIYSISDEKIILQVNNLEPYTFKNNNFLLLLIFSGFIGISIIITLIIEIVMSFCRKIHN